MSAELNGTLTNSANLVGRLVTTSGSGTNNYNDLVNKPSINGVTLAGNKTSADLGINIPTKVSQLQNDSHFVQQSAIPTKTSQLQNDSGFAYAANLAPVATTGSYNNLTDKPTIPTKTSQLQNDSGFVGSSDLATVATTGNYNDLTNKPTIPAAQVNSDWDSNSGVSQILNKPNLATVATSGNYNDLTNRPVLSAVALSGSYNDLINSPTIPTNSDFSLSGLSDTTITTPSSGQVLSYDGGKWKNVGLNSLMPTTITVVRGSTMSNTFPLPNVSRRGNVCIINFAIQLPAGTYNNTTTLWEISPKPIANTRALTNVGNLQLLNVLTDGTIKFNANVTLSGATYILGQAVYLTDG